MTTEHDEKEQGIWTCQDGRKVHVSEMDDHHVTATLRMLRRNVPFQLVKTSHQMIDYICDAPDGAGDAVNEELRNLQEGTTDYQCESLYPIFRHLVAEAKKRGLPAAEDEKRPADEEVRAKNMERANELAIIAVSRELEARVKKVHMKRPADMTRTFCGRAVDASTAPWAPEEHVVHAVVTCAHCRAGWTRERQQQQDAEERQEQEEHW